MGKTRPSGSSYRAPLSQSVISFAPMEAGPHRVVVIGGGFGGLQATVHLARGPVELTIVDRRNFHLFQPLTYQVATGALTPGEVCYPLRAIFRRHQNVQVVLGGVAGFDVDRRRLEVRPVVGDGVTRSLEYDTLIV